MTQNQDVYRKVGRGGAGNFYPSKKADEAAKVGRSQPLLSLPQKRQDRATKPWGKRVEMAACGGKRTAELVIRG
jgi:hypothetical protein